MNKAKIIDYLYITLGVFIVVLGFYFFLMPINLVTGGVMGLSVILKETLGDNVPISMYVFIANVLLLIIGGIFLGKSFFIKTIYATLIYPVFIFLLEFIDPNLIVGQLTEGKFLISSVFGGLVIGAGLGIVIKRNATTGGMDVVQKIMYRFLKIPFSWALYLTDGIIVLLAIFIFGIELSFYALGSMIISGVTIDWILLAGKSGYTVFIVTENYESLKQGIYDEIDRGITRVRVVGGYSNQDKDLIICTISRVELHTFKLLIKRLDPNAFSFVTKTSEAFGHGFSSEKEVL